MKKYKFLIAISFLLFLSGNGFSQTKNLWLTYSQSTFMYSPGIEFNWFVKGHTGIHAGVNTYFLSYDKDRVVNISDDSKFNFYNANLGLCNRYRINTNQQLGITYGLKMYYGPSFEVLHYYEEGGYNIYFDSSDYKITYGVDIGIFYSYDKVTGILKFDTARNKFRIGIGYAF